ncbi:MAG: hypothetical protein ACTSVV_18810 [Promethearchaeota archaeon]
MARCPECAGKMRYQPGIKMMVCESCGLALTRHELDAYWQKIRDENIGDEDDYQKKKKERKEWLEWYSKSKSEKERY